jgi:hypothetical protein
LNQISNQSQQNKTQKEQVALQSIVNLWQRQVERKSAGQKGSPKQKPLNWPQPEYPLSHLHNETHAATRKPFHLHDETREATRKLFLVGASTNNQNDLPSSNPNFQQRKLSNRAR